MSTNMTGFRWFSKNLCVLVLWTKVASALEGILYFLFMTLNIRNVQCFGIRAPAMPVVDVIMLGSKYVCRGDKLSYRGR